MLQQLKQNWWMFTVRGVAAILFGIAALWWPGLTLAVLIAMFGVFALVDGVSAIVSAVRNREQVESFWALLLGGAASVLVGLTAWFLPGLTALSFVYLIAGWSMVTGVLGIITAIKLRKEIEHDWFYVLAGIASVVVGVLLAASPGAGALALAWLIGAYAIAFGGFLCAFSVSLHRLGHEPAAPLRPSAA